jgi:integrase
VTMTASSPTTTDAARVPQARSAAGLKALDVQRAQPRAEPYRMTDTRGLYLWVKPTGTKVWRTNYVIGGKKHLLTLGEFPAMSLADARAARANVRTDVRTGAHPTHERAIARRAQLDRNDQTFRVMAERWHAIQAAQAWTPSYASAVLARLTNDAFPLIGETPISAITRNDIVDVIERRIIGTPKRPGSRASAHLLRQHLQAAFDYWEDRELVVKNPAAKLARRFANPDRNPQPAALTIESARRVLAAFEAPESRRAAPATTAALLLNRFQALTCVRPSEAREAQWGEVDASGIWRIPAERMKGRRGRKRGHDVALSRQALEVLEVMRSLRQRDSDAFVFPAMWTGRHAPLGRSTVCERMLRVLKGTGLEHVPHGWRACFSTILNEQYPGDARVIDAMLAHMTKGGVEGRYNRSVHTARMRALHQEWADMLLEGAPSAWTLAGLAEPAALAGEPVPYLMAAE